WVLGRGGRERAGVLPVRAADACERGLADAVLEPLDHARLRPAAVARLRPDVTAGRADLAGRVRAHARRRAAPAGVRGRLAAVRAGRAARCLLTAERRPRAIRRLRRPRPA